MFHRNILKDLKKWSNEKNRKPLILRGARQVGKTTAVDIFSKQYNQYIYLNLELTKDRDLFEKDLSIDELLDAIFFLKNQTKKFDKTLIFIDEIQNSPKAVSYLRYFYEHQADLSVIAAGSLLETLIDSHISFPVGRVTYLYVKPLSFYEFLLATGEKSSLNILNSEAVPQYAHQDLLKKFHIYTLIGGMPEVIQKYIQTKDIKSLEPIYGGLLQSYLDDVEKYGRNETLIFVMRHAIKSSLFAAGSRIRFEGFGKSHYKSREMGESLRTLEKAMLLYLMYPSTSLKPPNIPDYKKSPRLHFLDTGMINYFVGLQKDFFGTKELQDIHEGRIAEHIVGQELLAQTNFLNQKLCFWVREKKQSSAQVDYSILFDKYIIPIEVKAGKGGRLRSLHEFMDRAEHNFAVRISSQETSIDKIKTGKGKHFFLLNLPFYLTGRLDYYLDWFITKISKK